MSMRVEGTVKTWNEAKGFGFITPSNGRQDVFFHLSAFPREAGRPTIGQMITFEIELNREGKKRATSIQLPRKIIAPRQPTALSGGDKPTTSTATKIELEPFMTHDSMGKKGEATKNANNRLEPSRASVRNKHSPVGILALILAAVAVVMYLNSRQRLISSDSSNTVVKPAVPIPTSIENFRCDGRTHCSQMRSCAEAEYFLANCPGTQMDGNGDGEPCEQQWCNSY